MARQFHRLTARRVQDKVIILKVPSIQHITFLQHYIAFPITKDRIDLMAIRHCTPNVHHTRERATGECEGGKYGGLVNFDIVGKR